MSFDLILPFFRPIEHLLLSDTVTEIMVNPDSSVWIEEDGHKVHLHRIRFEQGALDAGLEVIANRFGKKLDANSPIMNLRLPDGSRLAAIIPPVVNPRPLLTIRKFTSRKLKMDDLVSQEFITPELAARLQEAVHRGDNILVSGGTGTGKTTLVNILANSIPDEDRILIIEDTTELNIRKPHVVSAEAQLDTHKSTIATIHANSANGALRRLANLALRGSAHHQQGPVEAEIRAGIECVVHLARKCGRRYVQDILECSSDRV